MKAEEKALLLQAVAEMMKANDERKDGPFKSVRENCWEAANMILESIKDDFKQKEK